MSDIQTVYTQVIACSELVLGSSSDSACCLVGWVHGHGNTIHRQNEALAAGGSKPFLRPVPSTAGA